MNAGAYTSGRDGVFVAFVLDISVSVRPRGESSVAGDPAVWTL
jgi:hypothetical protein